MLIKQFCKARRITPLTRRVLLLALALLLLGGLTASLAAWKLWDDAKLMGEQQANTLSVLLAEQTQRSMRAVDRVLQDFKAYGDAAGVDDPASFARVFGSRDFFEKMGDRLKVLPQSDALAAVSIDGALINLSRQWPPPVLDLSNREYVTDCARSKDQEVFVTGRVMSRVGHMPVFYLARCMFGSGGRPVGILMSVPTIAYYNDFYHSLGLPKGISVVIRRESGDPLITYPAGLLDAASSAPESGDGRFVARRPITFNHLTLEVGVSRHRVFYVWRQQVVWIALAATGAIICLLVLVCKLVEAIGRLERSQEALLEGSAMLEARTRSAVAAATALRESEAKLTGQTTLFEVTLDHMDQGLIMVDSDHRIAVHNRRSVEMLDLPPALMQSNPPFHDVIAYQLSTDEFQGNPPAEGDVASFVSADGKPRTYERMRPNGMFVEVRSVPLAAGGMVRTYTDITARKQAETRLAFIAYHDQLTGMGNRHLLYKTLGDALDAGTGAALTVLLLDLDRFKLVNDTLGHGAGDQLLTQVAQRMKAHMRPGDVLCRLGGDEFAAVLPGTTARETASDLANRLKAAVSAPYDLAGESARVGVSIGIALAPADGAETDTLMRSADSALYRAKGSGRDAVRFYEAGAETEDRARLILERDLRIALAQEQFEIVYQPIFDTNSGFAYSFEALVRWRHPVRGMLSPDQFVSIAEDTGIINELGRWVLNTACREAATWSIPVKIAVNVSTVQFAQPGLEAQVVQALEESGLPGNRLDLEVTESVLIADGALARDTMLALQRRGVRFVMDDFGTGHSSLYSLQGFPFQMIKIDRSFIRGIVPEAGAGAIVRAILTLAAEMGVDVVAEGVETQAQADCLRELGCHRLQGFLLQRPQSPEQVRDYLWRCKGGRQESELVGAARAQVG